MTHTFIHAIRYVLLCSIILTSCFLLGSHRAEAYFTTAQEEVRLGNNTGLFLIEYRFGKPDKRVHLPIVAGRGAESSPAMVSYQILNENDEVVTSGNAAGIVLSIATISETGMYVTPLGLANKFVLAVFFTPDSEDTSERYRLQVTHLPFQFDGTQQLQLNPSELQYYTTDLLRL